LQIPACGGSPAKGDCAGLAGAERDACFAHQAAELGASDPAAALRAARQVAQTDLRDLVLMRLVRQAQQDICEEIGDHGLRQACRAVLRRPHLGIPEPGEAGAVRAPQRRPPALGAERQPQLEERIQGCRALDAGLGDPCLERAAAGQDDPLLAWQLCAAMADSATRGACLSAVAASLGRAGQAARAMEVCAGLQDALWRGECHFRLSENLQGAGLAQRAEICKHAGRFQDECVFHLVRAVAAEAVLLARFGSFEEVRQGLAQRLSELASLLREGEQAPAQLESLFWYEAYYELLAEAAQQGRLAQFRGPAQPLDAEQERWLLDVYLHLRLRCALEEQPADTGLRALVARLEAFEGELGRSSDAPVAPLLGVRDAAALRYRSLSISEVPAALSSQGGCQLSTDERRRVLALWALETLPWSSSGRALIQGMSDPNVAVRATSLELAEQKAFFWQREDGQGRVRAREGLERALNLEPQPALRARMQLLLTALEEGQRPSRWAMLAEGVCAP